MYIHIGATMPKLRQSEILITRHPTLLRPELNPLKSYNAGLTLDDVASRCGGKPVAKLASNENPYTPAQEVALAIQKAIENVYLYPDPYGRRLVARIAGLAGAGTDEVILGDGSDEWVREGLGLIR